MLLKISMILVNEILLIQGDLLVEYGPIRITWHIYFPKDNFKALFYYILFTWSMQWESDCGSYY